MRVYFLLSFTPKLIPRLVELDDRLVELDKKTVPESDKEALSAWMAGDLFPYERLRYH